jgi:hypothetical protein
VFEVATWIGQSVSWVVIFLGWIVVNYQNNARETRKEIRASLLDLYKQLDTIEDAAFEYHTKAGDPVIARRLRRDIQQIAPRIIMARRGPMKINYSKPLAAFRKSITFENFDSSKFVAKSPQDPFFDDITGCKRDLIGALESAYNRAYS